MAINDSLKSLSDYSRYLVDLSNRPNLSILIREIED